MALDPRTARFGQQLRRPALPSALGYRGYRLFIAGRIARNSGSWIQTVALSWLVLKLTNDAVLLGAVAAAQSLPLVLLATTGGLIADQLPARRILLSLHIGFTFVALALALVTFSGTVTVPILIVLAIALGLLNAIELPTRPVMIAGLVTRADLHNAIPLDSASYVGPRVLGPVIAGAAIVSFGIAWCFLIAAMLTALAWVLLLAIPAGEGRPRSVASATAPGPISRIRFALAYVRAHRVLLLSLTVVGLVVNLALNFNVVLPVLARDVLLVDADRYGYLFAASGVGGLAAALLLALAPPPSVRRLFAAAIALGLTEIALGLTPIYVVAFGAMVLSGASTTALTQTANVLIQSNVDDPVRGRVMSLYATIVALGDSAPIGAMIAGVLTKSLGAAAAFLVLGASAVAIGAGAAFAFGRQTWHEADLTAPHAVTHH